MLWRHSDPEDLVVRARHTIFRRLAMIADETELEYLCDAFELLGSLEEELAADLGASAPTHSSVSGAWRSGPEQPIPDLLLLLETILRELEMAGLVVVVRSTPLRGNAGQPYRNIPWMDVIPSRISLTPKGRRAFRNEGMLPLGIDRRRARLRERGAPEELLARLEDADACRAHGMLRPSFVMLGVAFEAVIEAIYVEHVHLITGATAKAEHRQRIEKLRALFEQLRTQARLQLEPRDLECFDLVLAVTERVRQNRNLCAHPGSDPASLEDARALFENALWAAERWWTYNLAFRAASSTP